MLATTPHTAPSVSFPSDPTATFEPGLVSFGALAAPASGELLVTDPKMLRIRELAQRAAPTLATALVTGESGVGKEILARYIHAQSDRSGPFIKVSCAAVPRNLLEAELFGHERGVFRGAQQKREGKLEKAAGGTILLDEIGEMDLALQAKLLHVLEDGMITRLGGDEPVPLQARLIATTNRCLERCIAEGEFRQDLYYRLKVIQIDVPPLRDRREDVLPLANLFLASYADGQNRSVARLPPRIEEALQEYSWPGNVRELKHFMLRYAILPDEEMVLSELAATEALHRRRDAGSAQRPRYEERRRRGDQEDMGGRATGPTEPADGNGNGEIGRNGNGNGAEETFRGANGSGEPHPVHGGEDPRAGFENSTLLEHPFVNEHFWSDHNGLHLEKDYDGEIPLKSIATSAAEEAERQVILAVLEETRWNRKEAAARVDICYKTLLNKLERWGLGARSESQLRA